MDWGFIQLSRKRKALVQIYIFLPLQESILPSFFHCIKDIFSVFAINLGRFLINDLLAYDMKTQA
jgi:hypothetical protein